MSAIGQERTSSDLALVFIAVTHEFVGRVELKTTSLDPMLSDPATSGPAVSGVLLGDVEDWTSGVPLDVAVKRIRGVQPLLTARSQTPEKLGPARTYHTQGGGR